MMVKAGEGWNWGVWLKGKKTSRRRRERDVGLVERLGLALAQISEKVVYKERDKDLTQAGDLEEQ